MKIWKLNLIRAAVLALVFTFTVPAPVEAQRIRQDASGRLVPDLTGVRMSPEDQIKLGQQTKAEVYKQMPVLPDSTPVTRFVQQMGNRLAAKAPGTCWPFEFHVIAQKEINAFALPGGPIFINLGTIQDADEGELAGVMAHEISHVVMQHTARDAGKQQTTQTLGAIGAAIAGAVLGSGVGGRLASGAIQLGAGAISMSYSRADETEADLLGSQIMYDAGYNPYSMPEFFEKLAKEDGGGIQFLSDHPNPGNRAETVSNVIKKFPPKQYPRSDSPEFVAMKRTADTMKTYTAQQISQHKGPWNLSDSSPALNTGQVESVTYEQVRPSGSWQQFNQGGVIFNYPGNWQLSDSHGGILIAPPGGVASGGAIAYGVTVQFTKAEGQLSDVASQLAQDVIQGNPGMKILGGPNRLRVNGVQGVSYDLVGNSPISESGRPMRERDWLVVLPGNGRNVALVFTAPDRDYAAMKQTFQTMLRSVRVQ